MRKALVVILTLMIPCLAQAMSSVLLIGDSITRGVIGNETPDPVDGHSYAELLTESLGSEYRVVNAGCGGAKTGNWRPFAFPATCEFIHPTRVNLFVDRVFPAEIATLMLGTNDANYGSAPPTPADDYRRNLSELVGALFYVGVGKLILMSAPPRPEVETPNAVSDGNPAVSAALLLYRDVVLDICESTENVYCIDTHALLSADMDAYFYADYLHPNDAAHALIHAVLREQILAVPEAQSAVLLGFGLAGLAVSARRYRLAERGTTPRRRMGSESPRTLRGDAAAGPPAHGV